MENKAVRLKKLQEQKMKARVYEKYLNFQHLRAPVGDVRIVIMATGILPNIASDNI